MVGRWLVEGCGEDTLAGAVLQVGDSGSWQPHVTHLHVLGGELPQPLLGAGRRELHWHWSSRCPQGPSLLRLWVRSSKRRRWDEYGGVQGDKCPSLALRMARKAWCPLGTWVSALLAVLVWSCILV